MPAAGAVATGLPAAATETLAPETAREASREMSVSMVRPGDITRVKLPPEVAPLAGGLQKGEKEAAPPEAAPGLAGAPPGGLQKGEKALPPPPGADPRTPAGTETLLVALGAPLSPSWEGDRAGGAGECATATVTEPGTAMAARAAVASERGGLLGD